MSSAFLRFCCKFSMKIIFYLLVNTDKPKFVAFLLFVCTTASFIAQISSSENVSKRDAILAPVAKQWIAKDIPSYGSQSKRAKIAIHWFGKYLKKRRLAQTFVQYQGLRVQKVHIRLKYVPGRSKKISTFSHNEKQDRMWPEQNSVYSARHDNNLHFSYSLMYTTRHNVYL